MKKSLIFLASVGMMVLTGCNSNNTAPSDDTGKQTSDHQVVDTISFASSSYEVNPKDKVVIKENLTGVTYSFQGGTPDGVTLNATTGEIDFDPYGNQIPEKVYIATYNGKTATTIIRFKMQEEKPVVSFLNPSSYLVDGDFVLASAKTEKGREYAVSYSLKDEVDGISIHPETGKVSFATSVKDGTTFIVIAQSQEVQEEKSFIVMKDHIITSDNEVILEKGTKEDAIFRLNFNGNTDAESLTDTSNVKFFVDNVMKEVEGFSYDKAKKEVKIPASYLSTLTTGEHNFKVSTARNAVSLSFALADKIIYDANDFETIFEPNYEGEKPTFKENSLAGYYALGSDIDLKDYIEKKGDWAPIGAYEDTVYDIPFTGTFNGNGYTISSFSYKGMTAVNGLFGRNTGTIKNFKIQGAIEVAKSWSGVVCGNNGGTIENIIADVDFANEGQSATGVLCSVNHGVIQNCLSISSKVIGNLDPNLSWRQSGLLVGLNETDGSIKNTYALGTGQIFGFSQNSEVTAENAGKVFATLEEMKAYDYSKLPSRNFQVEEGSLPALKRLSISHTPGVFSFDTLPQYALKGDAIPLSMKIRPLERETEYNTLVSYSIVGESYGAKIVDHTLSLTDIDVPVEGANITIQATLKLDEYGIDMTASASILLYNSVSGLTITNTETVLEAGDQVEIKTATTPMAKIDVQFEATSEARWKSCYYSLNGNILSIKDDCPDGLDITVKAKTNNEETSKTFTVKKLSTFKNNNVIHYKDETKDFSYSLEGVTSISSILLDDTLLADTEYTYQDNTLTLKDTLIANDDISHILKIKDGNGNIYRAFMTKTSEEKKDETWLNNAYGANGYIKISSMEDFKKYFAFDGKQHDDLVKNMARGSVYALMTDLDFTGVDFHTIGENLNGSEDGVIFNADFYGLGHTIKNLSIVKEGYNFVDGFFRQIGGEEVKSTVCDITFENCKIQKTGGNTTGLLAGFIGDSAKIRNINSYSCSVISGDDQPFNHESNVGGIVGRTWSNDIKYCTFNGYNINLIGKIR